MNTFRESLELAESILDDLNDSTENSIVVISKENINPELTKILDPEDNYDFSDVYLYEHDEVITNLIDFGAFETGVKAMWFVKFVDSHSRYNKPRVGMLTDNDKITKQCNKVGIEFANYIEDNKTKGLYSILLNVKLLKKYLRHAQKLLNTRDYWYENGQLKFMFLDGEIDQLDFTKAEISRKLFESFFTLWKSDGNGEYTPNQIVKKYLQLFDEKLESNRIGEIVSNIRASILNPKPLLNNRLEWKFNKKNGLWIFKISPRNLQSY